MRYVFQNSQLNRNLMFFENRKNHLFDVMTHSLIVGSKLLCVGFGNVIWMDVPLVTSGRFLINLSLKDESQAEKYRLVAASCMIDSYLFTLIRRLNWS